MKNRLMEGNSMNVRRYIAKEQDNEYNPVWWVFIS